MGKFEILLPIILGYEGVSPTNPTGLADIPGDTGGVTNWGISQKAWSLIKHKFNGFPEDVRYLTSAQAEVIYRNEYFKPIFDDLPIGAALIAFDAEVNQGSGVRILQRALKVDDDGIVGPQTMSQLRLALRDVPALMEEMLWQRIRRYNFLAKESPTNQRFLAKLWIPRILQCREDARKLGV